MSSSASPIVSPASTPGRSRSAASSSSRLVNRISALAAQMETIESHLNVVATNTSGSKMDEDDEEDFSEFGSAYFQEDEMDMAREQHGQRDKAPVASSSSPRARRRQSCQIMTATGTTMPALNGEDVEVTWRCTDKLIMDLSDMDLSSRTLSSASSLSNKSTTTSPRPGGRMTEMLLPPLLALHNKRSHSTTTTAASTTSETPTLSRSASSTEHDNDSALMNDNGAPSLSTKSRMVLPATTTAALTAKTLTTTPPSNTRVHTVVLSVESYKTLQRERTEAISQRDALQTRINERERQITLLQTQLTALQQEAEQFWSGNGNNRSTLVEEDIWEMEFRDVSVGSGSAGSSNSRGDPTIPSRDPTRCVAHDNDDDSSSSAGAPSMDEALALAMQAPVMAQHGIQHERVAHVLRQLDFFDEVDGITGPASASAITSKWESFDTSFPLASSCGNINADHNHDPATPDISSDEDSSYGDDGLHVSIIESS